MGSLVKQLFGGERKPSLAQCVSEAEGRASDDRPDYAASASSKRLTHLRAVDRELTPYFAGAVGDADRIAALSQQAATLRSVVVIGALVLLAASVGLVRMAGELAQTRVVPYVVQVDKHGYVVPIGPAERDVLRSPRQAMAAIAQWVGFFRTVTADVHIQGAYQQKAFFFVTPKSTAAQKMREDYAKHPRPDGSGRRVEVEVVRVAQLGAGHTYSIEWTEVASDAQGERAIRACTRPR